jgi:ATP-dependent Clp protease ATP-binding subunit ClpB
LADQHVGEDMNILKEKIMEVVRKHFSPEFTNRIDELVIFNRLTQTNITNIVDVRLKEIEERLADRRITLHVSQQAKEWLGSHGYEPVYGARPLNRLIQQKILNQLAKLIIDGGIRNGEAANVDLSVDGSTVVIARNHESESGYIIEEPMDEDEDLDMD